ncbi:protein of unknown function [Azospirillum baldaniorum]|uniref:Uncharacterized protein n=1 Tax=Azospirillum baldaniorum TaxID=1064539 RepID=A0A9P1NKQ1_9PROT|nr:protein of unknown function [Azospirillum baldaniorum]
MCIRNFSSLFSDRFFEIFKSTRQKRL